MEGRGGDTDGPASLSLSLERLLDRALLSGDLGLLLGGLTDLLSASFAFSFLESLLLLSLERLLDRLLLFGLLFSKGERLLDFLLDLGSLGERLLLLSLSLWPLGGELLLLERFLCLFLAGDLLLEREERFGDLDITGGTVFGSSKLGEEERSIKTNSAGSHFFVKSVMRERSEVDAHLF